MVVPQLVTRNIWFGASYFTPLVLIHKSLTVVRNYGEEESEWHCLCFNKAYIS